MTGEMIADGSVAEEPKTELSVAEALSGLLAQPSRFVDDKTVAMVTRVGNFLPYLQVLALANKYVVARKAQAGDFLLSANRTETFLGNDFPAFILGWRAKAMQYKPTVVSVFNPKSPQFEELKRRSETPNSNCGYGAEFLLWLPGPKSYATLFMGNTSARIEAGAFLTACETGSRKCRVISKLITDKLERSWYVPVHKATDIDIAMPTDVAEMTSVVNNFKKPPESAEQVAEAAEGGDDRR